MAFEIDNHDDEFVMDDDFEDQTKIMVIGVGGGGGNAVSHMVEGGMTGIDYVVANTDVKALRSKDGSRMRVSRSGQEAYPRVRAPATSPRSVRNPLRRTATN